MCLCFVFSSPLWLFFFVLILVYSLSRCSFMLTWHVCSQLTWPDAGVKPYAVLKLKHAPLCAVLSSPQTSFSVTPPPLFERKKKQKKECPCCTVSYQWLTLVSLRHSFALIRYVVFSKTDFGSSVNWPRGFIFGPKKKRSGDVEESDSAPELYRMTDINQSAHAHKATF